MIRPATKSNPRRNPSPSGWAVARLWWSGPRRDTPVVYSKAGHPNVEQNTQGTWYIAGHKVSTVYSSAVAAMTVAETMKGDAYGQMKSNPRRNGGSAHVCRNPGCGCRANPRHNGQVFWTPQGPAVEAHSPTQWESVEIESRDGGKTYSVVAYGYADGREIRSVRAFGSKTVGAAQKHADDVRRELRIRANPRRNGETEGRRMASFSLARRLGRNGA